MVVLFMCAIPNSFLEDHEKFSTANNLHYMVATYYGIPLAMLTVFHNYRLIMSYCSSDSPTYQGLHVTT